MTLSWNNLFKFLAITLIFGVLLRFSLPHHHVFGPINLTDVLLLLAMLVATPWFGKYLASKTYKVRAELIVYYTIFWLVIIAPILYALIPSFGSFLFWALAFSAALLVSGMVLVFLLTAFIRKHE